MTIHLPSRCVRRLSTRASLLLLPLLVAACAVPGGPFSSSHPSSLSSAAPGAESTASASGADRVLATSPLAAALAAAAPADEAAPAPLPVDPLRPEVLLNLNDRAAQTELWVRVRQGFRLPDLDNELVHKSEQWYAARPDYVQRMSERGGRYLFHIVEELNRRGMPTELALLPFIESAYNPQALSSARASGMWQFIPGTGRDYALKQNIFRDDRRDVLASTRAALDYLQRLYGLFGDWQLALAAYNWGEGNVQRAINRNQAQGLPTDYANLRMPNETANYVPKLQAVKNIVNRPGDFGLVLIPLRNHPYFVSVPIERDMDVAVAAKLAGIPLDEFQSLNPQMNKPVILAAGVPQVLLPYDNAARFVEQLPRHHGPLASWTAWTVPKTMRPTEAADALGMNELQLREVNRIPARMLVKAGSTLLVPRGEQRTADVSGEVADNATMALAPDVPPLRRVQLTAGRHDSVASVARRYRLQPAQVAQWNATRIGAPFRPGQAVMVFVAANRRLAAAPAAGTREDAAPPGRVAVKPATRGTRLASVGTPTRGAVKAAAPAAARRAAPSGHPSSRTALVGPKLRVRLARSGGN